MSENFVVIVAVTGDKEFLNIALDHATSGLLKFKNYNGFISGMTHKSTDQFKIMQYLKWESKTAYDSCMNDPAWSRDESSQRFLCLVEQGHLSCQAETFQELAFQSNYKE